MIGYEYTQTIPRNDAERDQMLRAVAGASNKLGLTFREIQAVMWVYEQKLYTALGTPSESGSFKDASKRILRSAGFNSPRSLFNYRKTEEGGSDAEFRSIAESRSGLAVKQERILLGAPPKKPVPSTSRVKELRHDKMVWTESGASFDGAREIIGKYYKKANYDSIPGDALLVPMPSTTGTNVLPDALAERISNDFGQEIEGRVVGIAKAEKEAKNKRSFFDKINDPVGFEPVAKVIDEIRGSSVVIVEDVHNTGESWIAFANMLIEQGIDVQGVAVLASTDQRVTSKRDIERLSEKISKHLDISVEEAKTTITPVFHETFKKLFNKAEIEVSRSKEAAAELYDRAGELAGAYRNPLTNSSKSEEGILGRKPSEASPSVAPKLPGEPLRDRQNILLAPDDRSQDNPEFYSRLESAVREAKFGNAKPKQPMHWIGVIEKWAKGWASAGGSLWRNGIPQEELKWSGIIEWLESHDGPVTKGEVLDYLRDAGRVRLLIGICFSGGFSRRG